MFEEISAIYCFENTTNGKKYIGQAQNLKTRMKTHMANLKTGKDNCPILQNAWSLYGENSFEIYIIEECNIDDLDNKEIFYIEIMHSHVTEWGYNVSWGGDSNMRGMHHTEAIRKKISDAHVGMKSSDESRKKSSENMIRMWQDDDYRNARSGENNYLYGKHPLEETIRKQSESRMGQERTLEARKNISYGIRKSEFFKELRISQEIVDKTKELLSLGLTGLKISEILGISPASISRIKNNKIWIGVFDN